MAYSSDIGEAFRPIVPSWCVHSTWGACTHKWGATHTEPPGARMCQECESRVRHCDWVHRRGRGVSRVQGAREGGRREASGGARNHLSGVCVCGSHPPAAAAPWPTCSIQLFTPTRAPPHTYVTVRHPAVCDSKTRVILQRVRGMRLVSVAIQFARHSCYVAVCVPLTRETRSTSNGPPTHGPDESDDIIPQRRRCWRR